MHGAVVSWKQEGYIFTAPSGTGKTTHVRLWKEHLGPDVEIINGDKPVLEVGEDEIIAFMVLPGQEKRKITEKQLCSC